MKANRKGSLDVIARSGKGGNWWLRALGIPPSATRGFKFVLASATEENVSNRKIRRRLIEEARSLPFQFPKGRRTIMRAAEQVIDEVRDNRSRTVKSRREGRNSAEFEAFVAASRKAAPQPGRPMTALHRRMQSGDA